MANLEQAFLQDILENPEDDAPRLIYADWLEEKGQLQSLRAALIRAQCIFTQKSAKNTTLHARVQHRNYLIETIDAWDVSMTEIYEIEREIDEYTEQIMADLELSVLRTTERVTRAALNRLLTGHLSTKEAVWFSRGFPTVLATAKNVPHLLPACLEVHPLVSLYARNCGNQLREILRNSWLASVHTLRLEDSSINKDSFGANVCRLASSSHAKQLRQVGIYNLGRRPYNRAASAPVAESDRIRRETITLLLQPSSLPSLTNLTVVGTALSTGDMEVLIHTKKGHPTLRSLHVAHNRDSIDTKMRNQCAEVGIQFIDAEER